MENAGPVWGTPGPELTQMGSHKNGFQKEGFILSVDIGSTSIRCHVYDKVASVRGSCTTKVIISSSYSNYTRGFLRATSAWVLLSRPSRLKLCIHKWDTWRWTQMKYGKGLSAWSEELCKVGLQHLLLFATYKQIKSSIFTKLKISQRNYKYERN